jgi:hypothetical protein
MDSVLTIAIVCFVMWALPLVWAIAVVSGRRCKHRAEIRILALCAPAIFVAFGVIPIVVSSADSTAWPLAILVAIVVYLGGSWGPVLWSHLGLPDFDAQVTGFPVVQTTHGSEPGNVTRP